MSRSPTPSVPFVRGGKGTAETPQYGESSARVITEFRRHPRAAWVDRARRLRVRPFEWMVRRVNDGLMFGVAARVEDAAGRILLVRMNPRTGWTDGWVTPGGGAEPGETPGHAIRREIREETGGTVRRLGLWRVNHETLLGPAGRSVRWDFLQYTALWNSGEPRSLVPEEISEVRWFRRLPPSTEFRNDWLRPPRYPPSRSPSRPRTGRSRGSSFRNGGPDDVVRVVRQTVPRTAPTARKPQEHPDA